MTIFPAVDLQNGLAVRLKRGRREEATVFGNDPVAIARHWQTLGAGWLHIVDLDGAFDGSSANGPIISAISAIKGVSTQVGGGIRDLATARRYLEAGASRLIIGTLALEAPAIFRQMCAEFPGRIGVSLDADNGLLKSRGWLRDSGATAKEKIPALEEAGAAFIIYTDISRDGMQSGINLHALGEILESTRLPVIAAGGVANLDDVKSVFSLSGKGNLEGVISGRALYENTLDLGSALDWVSRMAKDS